jgi:hypothetical protein
MRIEASDSLFCHYKEYNAKIIEISLNLKNH